MAVSMKCEQCYKVKRCRLYLDRDRVTVYLCGPCAREIGFTGREEFVFGDTQKEDKA